MEKKPKDKVLGQHDEGEGNKTAARRAAEKTLSSAKRTEIENAALVGERHIAEGQPAAKRR